MTIGKPLYDRVLLRRVKPEEETKGKIIIPESAREKPMECEVVAVGDGRLLQGGTLYSVRVCVGDRVLVGKYSGNEIQVGGVDYVIVREEEILMILKEEK